MTIRATTMPSVLGEAAFRLLTSRLDQSPITPQAGTDSGSRACPAATDFRVPVRPSDGAFPPCRSRLGPWLSLHLFARARVFTVANKKPGDYGHVAGQLDVGGRGRAARRRFKRA